LKTKLLLMLRPVAIFELWKEAQQEVRQHWFIYSYIAAYIQMQYRVIGVHPTGLTVARGVSRCPQNGSCPRRALND
jgi:hypothetical protein